MRDPHALLNLILALHGDVRDEIVVATERQGVEGMAAIDRDDEGDTIYAIDAIGETIDAPLNVEAEVAWAGYANARVRSQVEPLLQQTLRARGWIADEG